MATTNLPVGADTIADAVAAATTGDILMLAPLPSFVIQEGSVNFDSLTFRLTAGEGDRLRIGDRLYCYVPGAEAFYWGTGTISSLVDDTVTLGSLVGPTYPFEGMIAIVCYNEDTEITVNKALRFIAHPYTAERLTTNLRIQSRLRGNPGPDPRVVVYGRFACTVDGTSFSGMTIIGHDAAAAVVGSAGVNTRVWHCVDCTIRGAMVAGAGRGIEYASLVRRCKVYGSLEAQGEAIYLPDGALLESTVVARWNTAAPGLVECEGACRIKNCTIADNQSASVSGVRGVVYTGAGASICANTIISGNFNFVFTMRTFGGGTGNTYNLVSYNNGLTHASWTNTNLSVDNPRLASSCELTEESPASCKSTLWTSDLYQAVLDMNRYVLDASQVCVGAYAWSKYKAAAFAWTVTRLSGLNLSDEYSGAWSQPDETNVEWTFQTPHALLRWFEVGGQCTTLATDVTPIAAFAVHFGMNADGKIRVVVRDESGANSYAVFSTQKRTPARWLLGLGDVYAPFDDSATVTDYLRLNYMPNYIACMVAFDWSDSGEWAASNIEPFDFGGAGAMPVHHHGSRLTRTVTITTERDEAQPREAPYLNQSETQRIIAFFKKLTSGTPVRFYATNHANELENNLYTTYNIPRVFDANVLDDNNDVALPWAESVMGRHTVTVEVCEMWGL